MFGKIRKGKYDIPGHLSSGAFLLLDKILKVRPSERLTVDEVKIFTKEIFFNRNFFRYWKMHG